MNIDVRLKLKALSFALTVGLVKSTASCQKPQRASSKARSVQRRCLLRTDGRLMTVAPETRKAPPTLSQTETMAINRSGLLKDGYPRREGRRMRLIRRLLMIADGVSAREMVRAIYPRGPWSEWCWARVRQSARRSAEPVLEPRSRPLLWRAKHGL